MGGRRVNSNSKNMKIELLGAAVTLLISVVALVSAAYAWYVANNIVKAETSAISAKTNGFILQIANREQGAQHGGNQMSLAASTVGNKIAPASTDDMQNWYVCKGWTDQGLVNSYEKVTFSTADGAKYGQYESGGKTLFAYSKSEFIVYTITQTGLADVYLDGSDGSPIQVEVDNGVLADPAAKATVLGSLRVGITTQELQSDGKTPTGDETLKVVYAPKAVSGKGNDVSAIEGKWTCIYNESLQEVTYPHFDSRELSGWVATRTGEDYSAPDGTNKIASRVGYNGMLLRVYIWMEGTDADCVNNAVEEDAATYSVSVKLAGIQAN